MRVNTSQTFFKQTYVQLIILQIKYRARGMMNYPSKIITAGQRDAFILSASIDSIESMSRTMLLFVTHPRVIAEHKINLPNAKVKSHHKSLSINRKLISKINAQSAQGISHTITNHAIR